jgi:MinD-like ATPase involved in chromosome partitioning or flagellar assembly
MGKIVAVHSFRGGTGKSNIVANTAACIACKGKKVGIVDTDIQSPGIHVLFGFEPESIGKSLNDYLWGKCSVEDAIYDVTKDVIADSGGKMYLIPSSMKMGEITRILKDGYDISTLNDGFTEAINARDLDYLFIDTHPGLGEETLLSLAISDISLILLRPDNQDYQGTSVTNVYKCEVASVLPLSEDLVEIGSSEIFYLNHREHSFSVAIEELANKILSSRFKQVSWLDQD